MMDLEVEKIETLPPTPPHPTPVLESSGTVLMNLDLGARVSCWIVHEVRTRMVKAISSWLGKSQEVRGGWPGRSGRAEVCRHMLCPFELHLYFIFWDLSFIGFLQLYGFSFLPYPSGKKKKTFFKSRTSQALHKPTNLSMKGCCPCMNENVFHFLWQTAWVWVHITKN